MCLLHTARLVAVGSCDKVIQPLGYSESTLLSLLMHIHSDDSLQLFLICHVPHLVLSCYSD